jgi:hypothetical protein
MYWSFSAILTNVTPHACACWQAIFSIKPYEYNPRSTDIGEEYLEQAQRCQKSVTENISYLGALRRVPLRHKILVLHTVTHYVSVSVYLLYRRTLRVDLRRKMLVPRALGDECLEQALHHVWKVLASVPLYIKYAKALTFEKFGDEWVEQGKYPSRRINKK